MMRFRACRALRHVSLPADLPATWRPDEVDLVPAGFLDARALDELHGALTGCALAIAETATIVLDPGPHQGRHALSLVRGYHLSSALSARSRSSAGYTRPWPVSR